LLAHLKTAEQFGAVLDASRRKASTTQEASQAASEIFRTPHFVLHFATVLKLEADVASASQQRPDHRTKQAKRAQPVAQMTVGVICPKRWAKHAVTRNTIKRQVYAVSSELKDQLPSGYFVVRLVASWSREQFRSATSTALKQAIRQELLALFGKFRQVAA
jgi:ribonuclease P protein component